MTFALQSGDVGKVYVWRGLTTKSSRTYLTPEVKQWLKASGIKREPKRYEIAYSMVVYYFENERDLLAFHFRWGGNIGYRTCLNIS